MSYAGLVFELECRVCGGKFTLPSIYSKIPYHPPEGEEPSPYPYIPYASCFGSGHAGINLVIKHKSIDLPQDI